MSPKFSRENVLLSFFELVALRDTSNLSLSLCGSEENMSLFEVRLARFAAGVLLESSSSEICSLSLEGFGYFMVP